MPGDEQIRDLAAWIVTQAPGIHCGPGDCKILITNFRLPKGVNPLFGVQLADELYRQLAASQKEFALFNRNLFTAYLEASSIDSDTLKTDESAGMVAVDLGARAVVTAEAVRVQDDVFRILVRFLNAKEKNTVVATEILIRRTPPAMPAKPIEVVRNKSTFPGDVPACFYMPNPPYSKKATEAKFEGAVLVDAVVYPDGSVGDFRILKSPGLDLDELVRNTMATWKCRPATVGGKKVPTRVQFEINFRRPRDQARRSSPPL